MSNSQFKGVKISTDLTPKQKSFVEHYCTDANFNAAKAAELAGYGLTRNIYKQLMGNPKIKKAIEERVLETKRRSWLTEDTILEQLWKEAQREGKGSSHAARINALVFLGKHIGMFREKEEQKGPQKIEYNVVNYNSPTTEKIVEEIKENETEVLEHKNDEITVEPKLIDPLKSNIIIKDFSKE